MISPFDVWRRNIWLWALPLAFCVVNLLVLLVYLQFYSGRVDHLETLRDTTQARLESYQKEHVETEEFLARLDVQDDKIVELYDDHFKTEEERFTAAIREVKRLARDAGLEPSNMAYPYASSDYRLAGRDINFSVNGTYRQVRMFINFLELSDHFLILREVALNGASSENRREPVLSIRLRVGTYFNRQPSLGGSASEASPGAEEAAS